MKSVRYLLFLLLISLFLFPFLSIGRPPDKGKNFQMRNMGKNKGIVFSSSEDFEIITLKIEGMTCAGCADIIQTALKAVPGVIDTTVSFERGVATIKVRKGSVRPEQFVDTIEKLGYKASLEVPQAAVKPSGKLKTTWGGMKISGSSED